jgi:N-acetylglucosaminyl-diphospho-decaprenol L-rhamnosyltransferase
VSAPVAIVVVSFNTRDLLARCLDSLAADVEAGWATVVVVDNGSADGSAELVRERFAWASLIEPGENLGFGRAVNLGVRAAIAARPDAKWIGAANADVALEPGALAALRAAGASDPGAGVLAPRLIELDGTTQQSLHPFPTPAFTLQFNLGRQRLDRRWAAAAPLDGSWNPDRSRRVPWAEGAFLLIRRAALAEVGGFDEKRFMYAEDLDLGWRLAAAGWGTRYVAEARVAHTHSAATRAVWGDERAVRALTETYQWVAETYGERAAITDAALNVAGAAVRWGWRIPAAGIAPGRFAAARDAYRGWARDHLRAAVRWRSGSG